MYQEKGKSLLLLNPKIKSEIDGKSVEIDWKSVEEETTTKSFWTDSATKSFWTDDSRSGEEGVGE